MGMWFLKTSFPLLDPPCLRREPTEQVSRLMQSPDRVARQARIPGARTQHRTVTTHGTKGADISVGRPAPALVGLTGEGRKGRVMDASR